MNNQYNTKSLLLFWLELNIMMMKHVLPTEMEWYQVNDVLMIQSIAKLQKKPCVC